MEPPNLTDRVALVTGSARGIGRELALGIAHAGGDVAIHFRSSQDAAERVVTLVRDSGARAVCVDGDVTDPEAVDGLFEQVESTLGTVDVLVNNVGAFAPEHWEAMAFETWQTVIETNLTGTYLCSKRALPAMREQGAGWIVNIGYASSEMGLVNPKNFPYFVSKAGVLQFTRMLAADTQNDGITVNAISPYVVENSDVFPDELPRGRPASFEDILQVLYFFLDPASGYLSGQNVEVSGGWLPEDV